jgi:FtsZ-interacting cell division protein ZipA
MSKIVILGMAILALMVSGCEKSEELNPTKTTTETTTERIAEAAKDSAGEMKESAQVVAEKAEDSEKETESAAKEAVKESEELAASADDKTKEIANQSADEAKEVMSQAKEGTTVAIDEAKQTFSPETIVLEASYGNITFPHAQHSDTFECSTCHGDTAPGPFDLDKNSAHDLCRDCHKQKGLGPTDCKGCHKK